MKRAENFHLVHCIFGKSRFFSAATALAQRVTAQNGISVCTQPIVIRFEVEASLDLNLPALSKKRPENLPRPITEVEEGMPIADTLLLCRPIVRTQVGIWSREGQKRFLLDFLTGPPPPPPPVFEWVVGFLRWRSNCHCERTCLFHERRCLALLKGGRQIALDNGWWWRRRQEVSPIFTPFPAPATSARVPYSLARKKKKVLFFENSNIVGRRCSGKNEKCRDVVH